MHWVTVCSCDVENFLCSQLESVSSLAVCLKLYIASFIKSCHTSSIEHTNIAIVNKTVCVFSGYFYSFRVQTFWACYRRDHVSDINFENS